MKIKYEFTTGNVEIEVPDEWATILVELDRSEYNNNHKETRRHYPLNSFEYEGVYFAVEDDELAQLFEAESLSDRLPAAISKLQPQQQKLIHRVLYEHEKLKDIAISEGVSKAAITRRMKKIYDSLKKYLL